MPNCPRCREIVEETALFCANCGAELAHQLQTERSTVSHTVDLEDFSERKRGGQSSSPVGKLVVVLHRPSKTEKFFFFMSGVLISTPFTLLAETISDSFVRLSLPAIYSLILSAGIIAPFIEEFAKSYPLFYRHGETERSIFTLGILTGLGFGLTEFVLYVFVYSTPILIRLPAILFHATNTSIIAYGIATKRPAKFYLLAFALHSLINLFAITASVQLDVSSIAGITITLFTSYTLSWRLYQKTEERINE